MKSGNAFANQLEALAVRKFTTTNPVKRIATMEGGIVNSLRDIWRELDPRDFFLLAQYKNSCTVQYVACCHCQFVWVKF